METTTDRRRLLHCMAWVGTGIVWTVAGGVPRSLRIEEAQAADLTGLTFAQISDSHIGFNKDANTDVPGTLKAAIAQVRGAPRAILPAAHGRHQPPVQARGVRSRRPAHR